MAGAALSEELVVREALRLELGGVYVVKCDRPLTREASECLCYALKENGERIGVKFLLLEHGLRIARHAVAAEAAE